MQDDVDAARLKAGYKIISSRVAYKNPWTSVREDIILHPNGQKGLYGIVERGEFAVIMPLHDDGKITLVQQFRYPVGERLWEFPMGMWENKENISPEALALGELKEETGLIARKMIYAGAMYQGAGYSTQKGHIFLAQGLMRGEAEREGSEEDMCMKDVSLEVFKKMIAEGEMRCMVSLAAYARIQTLGLL